MGDEDDVLDALKRGDENRHVAATNMNATSSRAHTIFQIKVLRTGEFGSLQTLHPSVIAHRKNLLDPVGTTDCILRPNEDFGKE